MAFEIKNGEVILVYGPNGVGKSALLAEMFRMVEGASYLPGHRQIHINSVWDSFGQQLDQFDVMLFQQHSHFSRYKNSWAEEHFKKLLKILFNKEVSYLSDLRDRARNVESESNEVSLQSLSPFDKVNLMFSAARLAVKIATNDAGLCAIRNGHKYEIEALSDGERAALFLGAATVCQQGNSVLLVDEPEKHLNPAVSLLFIEACTRLRSDIAFVFSTHDVSLIENLSVDRAMHIKDSRIIRSTPEQRSYDVQILSAADENYEEVKSSLIGARSKVLFVEGELQSADMSLYGFLYPDRKIIPKGGFQKVCEAVKALAGFRDGHWVDASGLIDGDGRSSDEIRKLMSSNIFVIPYPSIENCFLCEAAFAAYIDSDLRFRGGASLEDRLETLARSVPDLIFAEREMIIALRASWLLERRLAERKLSAKQIRSGEKGEIIVSVRDIVAEVGAQVDEVVDRGDWREILLHLPVKHTGVPNAVAKLVGSQSYLDYVRVILWSVETGSDRGLHLVTSLRQALPAALA